MQNNKNILLATTISVAILLLWTWFYEKPRMEQREAIKIAQIAKNPEERSEITSPKINKKIKTHEVANIATIKSRSEVLKEHEANRVKVINNDLHGSISLRGARFDDLTLAKYFQTTQGDQEVVLFSPAESKERYFADFGWISSDAKIDLPNPNTVWASDAKELTPKSPITLSWKNAQHIKFVIKIALDENYMFSVTQSVKNDSKEAVSLAPYGRINRTLNLTNKSNYILHEGPIGVFKDVLHEPTYEDMIEEKKQEFSSNKGGWLGITDKYWLSSILPDKNFEYSAKFSSDMVNQNHVFNSEFIGQEFKISPNEELKFEHHLFAGAKTVKLLDQYSKDYDVRLFDRAIDFGWFYFLTKPFFYIISFLHKILGNFGLAILAMTVLVKLALFPMANKSYAAIAKMKKLQPKIEALRQQHKDDRLAINREMMELYKREKVNPAAGCLPIIIQIPVFFALYKVLFVTLDMRHAPFYGWINDLSAPDPTSIFNLFGLLPFQLGKTFTIGAWPVLMGITMIIQQKLNPQSADPTQAKILKFMPYVLTFVLAAFPAGLVIYWTWSNVLSILQQMLITKRINRTLKS